MSDSESDGDVVTMRLCSANGCTETEELNFDEHMGEYFCQRCHAKVLSVEDTGNYDILLSTDDIQKVGLMFKTFDSNKTGQWGCEQFNKFIAATAEGRSEVRTFDSDSEMHAYVLEEYGVACGMYPASFDPSMHCTAFTVLELRKVYGGYFYNGMDALKEDIDILEEDGLINTGVLE